MTTPEERLQHSIAEFKATLDSLKQTGASQIAEVSRLKILVGKYPDHARQFVAEIDHHPR